MNIDHLVRPSVLQLEQYQSVRHLGNKDSIWLHANEYPISSYYDVKFFNLNRYPVSRPVNLIKNYSLYSGVNNENILVCRGSNEGIELLIRIFCEPGNDAILFCPPTYTMYGISASMFGVKQHVIPLLKNWQLDLKSISDNLNKVKLIYICHPNNPTGNLMCINDLYTLLDIIGNKACLVIDEAYIDFCMEFSVVNLLKNYSNLIILRTLSKAFALAGLRCGFILACNKIIQILSKIAATYLLPTPVTDLAERALNIENIKSVLARVKGINSNRLKLIDELIKYPCVSEIYPSFGNYLLVRFHSEYDIFNVFLKHNIIVRNQNKQFGLEHCLRITIGTDSECNKVLQILKTL